MIKISSIFIFGIIIALIPFSGFSQITKESIYIILGLIVAILSILIRRELHEVLKSLHDNGVNKKDTFSESFPGTKGKDKE